MYIRYTNTCLHLLIKTFVSISAGINETARMTWLYHLLKIVIATIEGSSEVRNHQTDITCWREDMPIDVRHIHGQNVELLNFFWPSILGRHWPQSKPCQVAVDPNLQWVSLTRPFTDSCWVNTARATPCMYHNLVPIFKLFLTGGNCYWSSNSTTIVRLHCEKNVLLQRGLKGPLIKCTLQTAIGSQSLLLYPSSCVCARDPIVCTKSLHQSYCNQSSVVRRERTVQSAMKTVHTIKRWLSQSTHTQGKTPLTGTTTVPWYICLEKTEVKRKGPSGQMMRQLGTWFRSHRHMKEGLLTISTMKNEKWSRLSPGDSGDVIKCWSWDCWNSRHRQSFFPPKFTNFPAIQIYPGPVFL